MKPASTHSIISERPIEGIAVGISVAHGEDSAKHGFTEEEMNRLIIRLADSLLSAGARLVFGHDWRPNGIMAAVADLAVRYEPSTLVKDGPADRACRITNLVPWDSRAELPPTLREDLEARGILRVEEIPLPEPLRRRELELGKVTLRAAALCLLRERLASLCDARVCLGGKYEKYQGFWPGILEEAWTAAKKGQPVFLNGMLGGAGERVLQASQTGDWKALTSGPVDKSLQHGLAQLRDIRLLALPDFTDVKEVLNLKRLQSLSGLDKPDWERLTEATDIEVVNVLLLKGLTKAAPGLI